MIDANDIFAAQNHQTVIMSLKLLIHNFPNISDTPSSKLIPSPNFITDLRQKPC